MSIVLNENIFNQTLIAGLTVTAGVVLKNGGTQYYKTIENPAKKFGMLLFVLGWLAIAYLTGFRNKNMISVAASMGVLGSVMMMMSQKDKGKKPDKIYGLIFTASWLALGYSMRNKKYGLLASVLVLFAMEYSLPKQRQRCVVDGAGMVLFALGWVLIAMANSVQN